jgi:hypothetical protein
VAGGRAQGREALQARVAHQVEIDEDGVGIAAGEPFAAAREIGDGLDLPGAAARAGEARFDRAGILRVPYDEEDTQAVAVGWDGAHISRTTTLKAAYTAVMAGPGVSPLTGEGPHKTDQRPLGKK